MGTRCQSIFLQRFSLTIDNAVAANTTTALWKLQTIGNLHRMRSVTMLSNWLVGEILQAEIGTAECNQANGSLAMEIAGANGWRRPEYPETVF